MNFERIQNKVLKSAFKRDAELKPFRFKWGMYEDNIVIINETASGLFIIPKNRFYLDIQHVFGSAQPIPVEKIIKKDEVKDIALTDTFINTDKRMLGVFKQSDNDEPIYYDSKLLKEYGKLTNPHYKGTDATSPILIYEDEVMVGLILPVRHKKAGD